MPNGEDRTFGVFQPALRQPQVHAPFDLADSQWIAVRFDQQVVFSPVPAEEISRLSDHRRGLQPHAADALDFSRFLGLHGCLQDRIAQFPGEDRSRRFVAISRIDRQRRSRVNFSAHHCPARFQTQVLQQQAVALSYRAQHIAIKAPDQVLQAVSVQVAAIQARFSGFIALHRAVEEHWRAVQDFHQHGIGQVSAAGQVHHGRIMLSRTDDNHGLQLAFLHQRIDLIFHSCCPKSRFRGGRPRAARIRPEPRAGFYLAKVKPCAGPAPPALPTRAPRPAAGSCAAFPAACQDS